MITLERESIFSATDIMKNFTECRNKTKQYKKSIIFKNNKPDLVMVDYDAYEELMNQLEDCKIAILIKEREKQDDGTRYSLEEVKAMFE